jgi:hypothetical protein
MDPVDHLSCPKVLFKKQKIVKTMLNWNIRYNIEETLYKEIDSKSAYSWRKTGFCYQFPKNRKKS